MNFLGDHSVIIHFHQNPENVIKFNRDGETGFLYKGKMLLLKRSHPLYRKGNHLLIRCEAEDGTIHIFTTMFETELFAGFELDD